MFIALSFCIDTEILGCKRQQFLQMRPNFLMSGIAAQLYNVFSFWTDYSKLHIKGKFTDKKLQKNIYCYTETISRFCLRKSFNVSSN